MRTRAHRIVQARALVNRFLAVNREISRLVRAAAAVQPASTTAFYFVARGDGSSQFSATLEEHNRAVNRYIRGKGTAPEAP